MYMCLNLSFLENLGRFVITPSSCLIDPVSFLPPPQTHAPEYATGWGRRGEEARIVSLCYGEVEPNHLMVMSGGVEPDEGGVCE